MFDTEQNVNVKLKTLVGDTLDDTEPYKKRDTNITSIYKSSSEPNASNQTAEHIISADGYTPIYAWFNDTSMYWYKEADEVYLNKDTSYIFYNIQNATSIDTPFKTFYTEI